MSAIEATKRIRLAFIGAGIYARDAHLPAIKQLRDRFEVVAVYSRSTESAHALAERLETPVAVTTDLDELLARTDVDALDVVLPIPAQPAILARALASGKHVISEKPIAPDRATALPLLELHGRQPGQVWMVAENWRYEEAFVRAAALVRDGVIGQPVAVHYAQYKPMTPKNKYYHTAWRRSGEFQGGFLLDGGIHHIAVLRMIVGEIAGVAAMARLVARDLPPVDTLTATLHFANGVLGTYLATFALGTPFGAALTVTGERGSLRVDRGRIELANADDDVTVIDCEFYNGVQQEFAAFADAIRDGTPQRNTAEAALADLAVVEAMLQSAANGGQVTAPRAWTHTHAGK